MRKFLTMLVLASAFAMPAAAQTAAQPSAKTLELTRRVVAAMHVEQTMAPMMRGMMQQQMQMIVAQRKNLSEQQRTLLTGALTEAVGEMMDSGLMTTVMEKLIPAYAEVYSDEELQAMLDFYESPIGQSVLMKMPRLGPAATRAMIEITPKIQADLEQRVTKKLEGLDTLGK
jgi:hypothetical protein